MGCSIERIGASIDSHNMAVKGRCIIYTDLCPEGFEVWMEADDVFARWMMCLEDEIEEDEEEEDGEG